jgi:hypothetical protein
MEVPPCGAARAAGKGIFHRHRGVQSEVANRRTRLLFWRGRNGI